MFRRALITVLLTLSTVGLSLAQDFPKPGPEHEKLKEMVGTWDCVMDIGGQKSKATATYKLICGGMWVASDFEGDFGGMKFQGHGLDGYDQNKKKYVGVWVDSMSSAPMHMEGNYEEGGKLLVMTGESVGAQGQPEKFKGTTEMKNKDHVIFKMYMIQPGG